MTPPTAPDPVDLAHESLPEAEWLWLPHFALFLLGPVDAPGPAAIEAALAAIGTGQPWERWQRDGRDGRGASRPVRRIDADSMPALVAECLRWRDAGLDRPVQVAVSDRYLAVWCNHAVGDGLVIVEIIDAVLAGSCPAGAGATAVPVRSRPRRRDYAAGLAGIARRDLAAALRLPGLLARYLRMSRPGTPEPSGAAEPRSGIGLAVVDAAAVTAVRDRDFPGVSVTLVLLALVVRALDRVGLLGDSARLHVQFDLRRLARRLDGAGGNCVGDVRMDVGAGVDPREIANEVAAHRDSGVLLAIPLIKSLLAGRGPACARDGERPAGGRTEISWSDLGRIERWGESRTGDGSRRRRTYLFVPQTGATIGFSSHRVAGRILLACGFDAARYDQHRVDEALALLAHPDELLTARNAGSRRGAVS